MKRNVLNVKRILEKRMHNYWDKGLCHLSNGICLIHAGNTEKYNNHIKSTEKLHDSTDQNFASSIQLSNLPWTKSQMVFFDFIRYRLLED